MRAASIRHMPVIAGYVFANTTKKVLAEKAEIEK